VVLRAVAKDRFARFQSAAEFREAAAAVRAGAVGSRRPSTPDEFNAALFGVTPHVTAGAESTFRQLTVKDDERVVRTQSRPPVAWIWGGISIATVVIVAVLVWTLSLTQTNIGAGLAVTVPDVQNQSWDEGSAQLTSLKLIAERVDTTSDTIAEGTILYTEPGPGINVQPQQKIQVFVSSGPQQMTVPQLVGLTQEAATAKITDEGFVLGAVTSAHSPSAPAGQVISTTPAPPTKASGGTTIDLVVSDGIVTIPDVTGKTIGEGTTLLSGPSVRATVVTQADGSCSGGLIASQSLTGDHPQGSSVTLVYCGGAAPAG
jgi:eukaryotic-like serine/threonine-protein kinase